MMSTQLMAYSLGHTCKYELTWWDSMMPGVRVST